MKIYQSALVAALSTSFMASYPVVAQDNDVKSAEDLACNTDGFSTLCALIKGMDLFDYKTAFAPTDKAFANAAFDFLSDDAKKDIVEFHFAKEELPSSCGDLLEMLDGKDSRTLCDKDDKPMYQKGMGNSKISPPKFDANAAIALSDGAKVYTIDQVLLPKGYYVEDDGKIQQEETRKEIAAPDPTDGLKQYYLELLTSPSRDGPNRTDVCLGSDPGYDNPPCDEMEDSNFGQAGANVTKGYEGDLEVGDIMPITEPYIKTALCPVNVHWHKGAEHFSVGEYDCSDPEKCGPPPATKKGDDEDDKERRDLAEVEAPLGYQCNYYDPDDEKFTKPFDWKFCVDMEVGQTYEVHWPHSAFGACGTPNQYQTPFKDGVFCNLDKETFETVLGSDGGRQAVASNVGVQAQVFTIVNDDTGDYYYENLFGGMIVDDDMGTDMAIYTGSTTGSKVNNEICSPYTPITWQVDRKCHLISASSFDKMCSRMLSQRDNMSGDLYPHGSRIMVADHLAADNQQSRRQKKKRGLLRKKQEE